MKNYLYRDIKVPQKLKRQQLNSCLKIQIKHKYQFYFKLMIYKLKMEAISSLIMMNTAYLLMKKKLLCMMDHNLKLFIFLNKWIKRINRFIS